LCDYRPAREVYRAQGRIEGRADSEVGARWLEDEWPGTGAEEVLGRLHRHFGGEANLALLEAAAGRATVYAGNRENPVFTFDLGDLTIAATGLYSLDRSLFQLVAPTATDRHLLRLGRSAAVMPRVAADTEPPRRYRVARRGARGS
ncbi:MAG: hypothetical protein ACHQZR_07050, partial [Candidatus Limnocylindrales bacterium]